MDEYQPPAVRARITCFLLLHLVYLIARYGSRLKAKSFGVSAGIDNDIQTLLLPIP